MYASADWQVALVWPRCGLMQSPTLAYVALGQNCLMSPAHSLATQMAFDRIVEQPTESSVVGSRSGHSPTAWRTRQNDRGCVKTLVGVRILMD